MHGKQILWAFFIVNVCSKSKRKQILKDSVDTSLNNCLFLYIRTIKHSHIHTHAHIHFHRKTRKHSDTHSCKRPHFQKLSHLYLYYLRNKLLLLFKASLCLKPLISRTICSPLQKIIKFSYLKSGNNK